MEFRLIVFHLFEFQAGSIRDLHDRTCSRHASGDKVIKVNMSIDGVSENQSTSRSLEVMSVQFETCKEIYPCVILRPEVFQKKAMKESFEVYIAHFLEDMENENMQLNKVIVDAPERAYCRKQKSHGGFNSCDLCLANPESIRLPGRRGSK